jgi:zinc finger FYVE domain-containing protein 26
MATEKEIALLSRVAANHLFLAQFEPLRASLLSLRKRHPDLASSFLRAIVSEGGQIADVHWSITCPSPSHLAWLASLELSEPHSNRLQVEFLILIHTVLSELTGEITTDLEKGCLNILSKLLDLGRKRLKGEMQSDEVSEEELISLWKVFLKYAEIFHAISVNIRNQALEEQESNLPREGTEVIMKIQKSVQLANLRAIEDCLESGVVEGVFRHLPFLCRDFGVAEEEYK